MVMEQIQPLNLCRQFTTATIFLDPETIDMELIDAAAPLSQVNTMRAAWARVLISSAQKFILPPGGMILNDEELRGLGDTSVLHLPFPITVLEFLGPPHSCIAGSEITASILILQTQTLSDGSPGIGIRALVRRPKGHAHGEWMPTPMFSIPIMGFLKRRVGADMDLVTNGEEDVTLPLNAEEQAVEASYRKVVGYGAWTVLGFLNALACSNVGTLTYTPKQGKQLKNALPFDEYRILTIEVKGAVQTVGGTHTGRHPREHLRRGHIRQYERGLKIWVNSCVVAPGMHKITKDYRIKIGAAK